MKLDKVLVPLDGSSLAEAALPKAVELAEGTGARLILLRAVQARALPGTDSTKAQTRAMREARAYLTQVTGRLAAMGLTAEPSVWSGAAAPVGLTRKNGVQRIVMSGAPRPVTAFQKHVPHEIAGRIVGSIPASWHELASAILPRAAELPARLEREEETEAVDAVLTEAAKSRQAVAGLEETLDAVARGAVHRLYLVNGVTERGQGCDGCGTLQRGASVTCRLCGSQTKPTELGEAMVSRVIAAGGTVKIIEAHPGLARVGAVAALLRYPL